MPQIREEQSEFDPYPELEGELLEKAIRRDVAWAISVLEQDARHFARHMNNVLEHDTWRRVAKTWPEFCQEFVGMDGAHVEAIVSGVKALGYEVPIPVERVLGPHGTNQHTSGGGDIITSSERGTSATYTLARLDRDRPDLAAQVRSGEMSANAAAIEAGFRKKTPPLRAVQSAWRRASQQEREGIAAWVDDQMSPLKWSRCA